MSFFLLIVLCVTLLVTGCAGEVKNTTAVSEVRITVDAGKIRGDISSLLAGVNLSFYYDTDAIWADGSMADYVS